jgi:uncharacterized membrane protein
MNVTGAGDVRVGPRQHRNDPRRALAAGTKQHLSRHGTWVWTITALAAVIYSVFSVIRYFTYQDPTYDLGIFDQAVRSYAHFQPGISIAKGLYDFGNPNFSVLGDHFSPIDAALAPLYWICNSPIDLLIAQAVLFALAIPPIWVFTRRAFGAGRKGTLAAYCVSTGYALSWTIATAAAYSFHEVAFEPVLTAVALERLQKGRLRAALLALFGLLLIKEDMGLYVAGLGLGLAATRALAIPTQRLTGLVIAAVGLAVTFVAIYVVIPAMGGRPDFYWAYQALGNNVPQALWHIISHPVSAAKLLVTPWVKVHTMLLLFAPFLFLSLLSPITWAVFPLLLERMLANTYDNWWQDSFQYNACLVVPLALGAVDGVLRLGRWAKSVSRRTMPEAPQLRPLIGWVMGNLPVAATVAFALAAVAMVPYFSFGLMFKSSFYHRNASAAAEAAVVSHVPSGVIIETTGATGPHLDNRDTVEVWDVRGPLYPPWVIVNDRSHQFGFSSLKQQVQRVALLRAHGYVTVFSAGGYSLMHAQTMHPYGRRK